MNSINTVSPQIQVPERGHVAPAAGRGAGRRADAGRGAAVRQGGLPDGQVSDEVAGLQGVVCCV